MQQISNSDFALVKRFISAFSGYNAGDSLKAQNLKRQARLLLKKMDK